MTCNPYSSVASRYSNKLITPNDLARELKSFEELLDMERDPAARYDSAKLSEAMSITNELMRARTMEDFPFLLSRMRQAPMYQSEYADFLTQAGLDIDTTIDRLKKERRIIDIARDKLTSRDPEEVEIEEIRDTTPVVVVTKKRHRFKSGEEVRFRNVEVTGIDSDVKLYGKVTSDVSVSIYTDPDLFTPLDGKVVVFDGTGGIISDITSVQPIPVTDSYTTYSVPGAVILPTYTPSVYSNDLLGQLDFYYNSNFSESIVGGFCGMFQSALLKLQGYAALFDSTLNALKSGDFLGAAGGIAQLLGIKTNLFNVVDSLSNQMLTKIDNMVNSAITQFQNATGAFRMMMREAETIKNFFSEENLKGIKSHVEGIITRSSQQFASPTIEVVQYLVYRFCQLAESLSTLMQAPVTYLNTLINNFNLQYATVRNMSMMNTSHHVNNGAIRMPYDERVRQRQAAAKNINGQSYDNAGLSPDHYITTEVTEDEKRLVASLTKDGNQYIKFAPQVINQNDPYPEAGWKQVLRTNPEVYIFLMRVAKRMGKQFTINSAYRSPAYNAGVGGAKGSMHMSGKAVDVSMSGVDRDTFIKYASQEGFRGIGTYGSFIHVDLGSRRTWGSYNVSALALHKNDQFRNGKTSASGGATAPDRTPPPQPTTNDNPIVTA